MGREVCRRRYNVHDANVLFTTENEKPDKISVVVISK
jgi:hypothetical protein